MTPSMRSRISSERFSKGIQRKWPCSSPSAKTSCMSARRDAVPRRSSALVGSPWIATNSSRPLGRTTSIVNSRAYYVQGTAQDLALRAVEVYLEVLKRRELLDLAKNNLQAHLRVNDQIGLRSQRGVGSTADVDQSRARRALAENNFYTAQVDLNDAEANFFSATGRMPDELEPLASLLARRHADIAVAARPLSDYESAAIMKGGAR